ncbi:serine hydrolase [Companilactobacillus zhachilii]|uniref:serine hydrolase n=1 Tax=Companilactobacillus zhachilii TaxID=2304606 RepID=UPI001F0DAAEF|nr:serine hydrolase [Companilactobacillus zhachilii]
MRILLLVVVLVAGLGYYFNNSYASGGNDNAKTDQVIKSKQRIIKHNLTSYLNSVTKDGTASVSFYNLGAVDGSDAADNKYAKVYQKGSLEVESNAHTAKTAASTYKLYLAAYLMSQKQNGNFSWTTDNETGFEKMIVNSENDYAEEQINNYGADELNAFNANQNWYTGVFQAGQGTLTTSYSLQLLLEDLAEGKGAFENKGDRAKILNWMGKQIYRTGIPTGATAADAGTTVQDKVGFLDDTNNDAGIVTLPNGERYILVILTNGHKQSGFSGFKRIAEITKNVQKIVYGSDAGTKIVNY